jgi:hypothetical protein
MFSKNSFHLFNPNSAVEIDNVYRSRGEPGGAKAQMRTITIICRVLGPEPAILAEVGWQHRTQGAATSRWLIAFAPEGLPLDRGVTLNCGIRVQ